MSSRTLFKLSGFVVSVGAILTAIGYILKEIITADGVAARFTHPLVTTQGSVTIAGVLLLLLGLPAVYARQAHRAGWLGVISFVMTFLGLAMLEIGTGPIYTFVTPALAQMPQMQPVLSQNGDVIATSTAFAVYFITALIGANFGTLLFGVATFRAHVYPRWIGGLLIVAPLATFTVAGMLPFGEAITLGVLMLAFVGCGRTLMRDDTVGVMPTDLGVQVA